MSTSNSMMYSMSNFLETMYFANRADHQDKFTDEQIARSDRLCKEMYEVMLGPDSDAVPVCLDNVRPLTVVPMLLSAGYTQLSLSLLEDVKFTVGMFNIEAERNRICRIFNNAPSNIIEHLLYEKGIFDLIINSYDVEKYILSSLPYNRNEGIYAVTQSLLGKIENKLKEGGGDFDGLKNSLRKDAFRLENIKSLIFADNDSQLSEAVTVESMDSMVDIVSGLEGSYICKLKYEPLVEAVFNNERFCSDAYCQRLLDDVCSEYWLDDRFFIFIDHIIGILPFNEVMKGVSEAKEHIWGEEMYAMPLIQRLHLASESQGDALANYPNELAKIVQKSVGFRKKVGLPVYAFLYRKGAMLGEIESRTMLSVLKEVHGMTPLQMLTNAKSMYQPFLRLLVKEVLSNTKKTPLSLLEVVDDQVKPYVMEALA